MNTPIDKKRFGPWAVITGASSGIGRELAQQIAEAGINVVLVARRRELLEEAGLAFGKNYGVEHRVVVADVADASFIHVLAAATDDLDIGLVASNAGAVESGHFLERTLADLQYYTRVNATSHMEIAHYFGRRLAKRGQGGLMISGAMGATRGIPYIANDSASKAYVQTLCEALHVEFRASGVNVMVLVIGPTNTAAMPMLGLDPLKVPMKVMSPKQCAREGLSALATNRATYIPGRLNRIMNALTPAFVTRKMMGKMLGDAASKLRQLKA